MQIHELFQHPKKVNEDLSSFFGLNNPVVKQAWDQIGGELIQSLSARFTKDPRYANMSIDQRKKAIAQDQAVQQMAQQKYDEWQKYIASLETKARGTPLTDQQYQAAFLNWITQSIFGNNFNSLAPAVKATAQQYFTQFVSHRGDPDAKRRAMFQTNILASLIADETARAVQIATDLQKAQAATGTTPAQSSAQQPTQQGQGYTVQPTQPGYKAVTTNAPAAAVPQIGAGLPQVPVKPQPAAKQTVTPADMQKFKQIAANAVKA